MFIHEGIANVYLETEGDNHVVLNILPAGSMIGLAALFEDRVYPYSVEAVEKCTICAIDIRFFEEYIRSDGEFASSLIKELNDCATGIYGRLFSLTQKQLYGRFADALLFLSEHVYKSHEFDNSLSRKGMADLTAMSQESVSRLLHRYVEEGIISVNGKHLKLIDMDKLRQISRHG